MFYAILATIILPYPILCLIGFGILKFFEIIVNKIRYPKRVDSAILLIVFVLLAFPIHYLNEGPIRIDNTFPVWTFFMVIGKSNDLHIFLPETLFRSGYGWIDYTPGIFYKTIWLGITIFIIRKILKHGNPR